GPRLRRFELNPERPPPGRHRRDGLQSARIAGWALRHRDRFRSLVPPSPMDRPSVLIVGAGPTGLVLGLWLNRLGVAVRIVDKTAAPGTTSRALAVQARTLEFYRQVGIADAVIDGG